MADAIEFGTRLSQQLCLSYVVRDAIAFREYFTPRVSRLPFWHRYTFGPVLLAQNDGDTVFLGARAIGKSYAILNGEVVRHAINHAGEETMMTSLRKTHVVDRMERVIDYFELVPLFRLLLKNIKRQPIYTIELWNGHLAYGTSVGDDPDAKMVQGKHVSKKIIEEAHQYPTKAFQQLKGAEDPRGCVTLMVGVPDGRLDTPFRHADSRLKSFAGRRFHLSRRTDPFFTQRDLEEAVEIYGTDSDQLKQQLDAEWGHPVWAAWDLELLQRCMDVDLPLVYLRISGRQYRERGDTPEYYVSDLPLPIGPARRVLAMDVGYTQPSELGVFELKKDRWTLIARIELVERMEHDDQAAFVDAIAARFDVEQIGIDTSEGEGRAIARVLETDDPYAARWSGKLIRYGANETMVSSYARDDQGNMVEVYDLTRDIGTLMLRAGIRVQLYRLPVDDQILEEFTKEVEYRGPSGKLMIRTPADCHVVDMFRVKALMEFLEHPPIQLAEGDHGEFVLPEWGDASGTKRMMSAAKG